MKFSPRRLSPRAVLFDSLFLFLLAAGLIYKLFTIEYLNNWGSIDSTFIADSRMLAEHLPHPGWQPFWYGGTRFDYIYPPALRYGTTLLAKGASISPARAYHLYTAILYAFGIAAVYWLALAGSGSRCMGWCCAVGALLLSPSFALLPLARHDSPLWVPQRLHVMVAYGEGPHIAALSWLGAALAASVMAFRSRRLLWVALAGLACALVVSNNFYGATALAIFFPLLAWAEWLGGRAHQVVLKALGIAALAWGFCAFWLTPSYLRVTLENLKWVAQPGNVSSRLIAGAFLVLVAAITWWWGHRRPDRSWTVFVFSSAAVLLLIVAGYHHFGLRVTGDPNRLVPELDLALILALTQTAFWCWKRRQVRFVSIAIALAAAYPAAIYLRHFNSPFSRERQLENRYEYQLSAWVHNHLPGQRTLATGSLRLWYDAWFDNPQLDGGSVQGLKNQKLMEALWQIVHGRSAEATKLWLQAMGTDAVVVPDKISLDQYRDYEAPEKFAGAFPQLFDDGRGTRIYAVARRYVSLARVVDRAQQAALLPIRDGEDIAGLQNYVNVIEAGPDAPATMAWHGVDAYTVEATLQRGQALLVQETFDDAWQATTEGHVLPTRPDSMGFTVVDVPAGKHTLQMRFMTPVENRIGYALFAVTCAVFVWLAFARRAEVMTPQK